MLKRGKLFFSLLGFAIFLFIWFLLKLIGIIDPSLLPGPFDTFSTFFRLLFSGNVLMDILATCSRMLTGLTFAMFAGVVIGLIIGAYRRFYLIFEGIIDFFRSIPVTTLYPVFVLFFGIGHLSKIAMVFWSSFFIITLNTAYGIFHSGKQRVQMAKLYGASNWQIFKWIYFFNALPQTLIGIRIALSYSLIVEILCEMFMGSKYGLGQRIIDAFTTYAMTELFALIIIAGIIGFGFNKIFLILEKNVTPWLAK